MSKRRLISTGSTFEELAGYSRAVVDGAWVFVSGCTGFDYAAGTISDDVVEQTHQTFRNIEWALAEAGASLADVVRVRLFLDSRDDLYLRNGHKKSVWEQTPPAYDPPYFP